MKNSNFLIFALLFLGIGISKAQFTSLLNFNNTNGKYPYGDLMLSGNVLYGMAQDGGANGDGCIFSIHTDGTGYKDMLDFNGTNGKNPTGSLLLSGKKLYGMTTYGGTDNDGVVFSIDTNGGAYNILIGFTSSQGWQAYGSLILLGNKLYGMTKEGGTIIQGNIFCIDTNGTGYKDMHDFSGGSTGQYPVGNLTFSGSKFYGMTEEGGAGDGDIFAMDSDGNNFKILYNLTVAGGQYPWGSLTLSGETLFGMTSFGGLNDAGDIFSIDTNGSGYRDIWDFDDTGSNGGNPYGSLKLIGNTLYGLTAVGGASSDGNIFSIDTNGTAYRQLFKFSGSTNGEAPWGSLTISGIDMYGMTAYGGPNNDGTIFKFNDNTLGIDETKPSTSTINVYPNPNNGKFNIVVASEVRQSQLEIYNVLGEQVYSQSSIQNSTFNIDLSSQPSGVYLYRIIDVSGELIGKGKLVIQK